MKEALTFLFIFIFLAGFYISVINSDVSKIDNEVFEKIQKEDDARVMIKLEEKSLYQKILNVDTKQQVIDSLNNKVKHDFNDSVSAIISEEDLINLENNPNIKSVKLVGIKHIFLQDSVPLVNATTIWLSQINNVNLTGIGETVCVLDTGADFTHPDLSGKNLTCVIDCVSGNSCYQNCSASDDNGHGTHVTGIVGANGSLKGVAPGVNLMGVKVCDSSGNCPDDDVRAGIDWCVANSSQYNISVISMSLGGGQYDSYCDGINDSSDITGAINNAVGKNISVIVATGNDGNSTHIASPSCIQNATAVGSTTKSDSISSFSNRNNLTDLVAPGSNINSTIPNGYGIKSGTSMATPHVAGAFALIRQFKKLETGKILTPEQIENSLKITGKQINDSGSGLNFSRIDVYSSILSLDVTNPNVILISPADNVSLSPQNFTFKCNTTDELQLSNLTLKIWNSTSLYYENTTLALENSLEAEFNLSLTEDNYNWNCLSLDKQSNSAFSSANFSLTVREKFTSLSSPNNNSYTNVNSTDFTCSSQTDSVFEFVNLTFYLWNSTDNLLYNETKNISGNSNETTFNFTLTNETSYLWNCLSYDNSSESFFSDLNFTLTYDVTNPNITLISPSDEDSSLTGTNNVDFEYNVSEENLANCSLIINDAEDQTNNSINVSITNEFTKSLSAGDYDWKINCIDFAGNIKNSSARTLTINSLSSSPTSSSGGGGGSSVESVSFTYIINEEQIKQGVSKNLRVNDKLKFNVQNEEHSLTINKISSNELTLTISSDPVSLILKINETRKVNLNNNEYYDLEVFLDSIKNSKANISIKLINEKIPIKNIFNQDNKINQSFNESENKSVEEGNSSITGLVIGDFTLNKQIVIGIVVVIFVFLVIYFLIRFKKHFNKSKSKVKRKKRFKSKAKRKKTLKFARIA